MSALAVMITSVGVLKVKRAWMAHLISFNHLTSYPLITMILSYLLFENHLIFWHLFSALLLPSYLTVSIHFAFSNSFPF